MLESWSRKANMDGQKILRCRQWRLQDIFFGGLTLYIQLFRGAKKPKISILAVV